MNLNEAVDSTHKVISQMPGEKWGPYQRLGDLLEETGELANAIQVKEGWKTEKRAKSELVDSVCDVLFSVFGIAALYNINLDTEYPKVLEQINNRRANGEFDQVE